MAVLTAADGNYATVNNLITAGTTLSGDTVRIPNGTWNWGTNTLNINKAITLQAVTTGSVIINSGAVGGNGFTLVMNRVNSGIITLDGLTFSPASGTTLFKYVAVTGGMIAGLKQFVIKNCTFNMNGGWGAISCQSNCGVISNCTFNNSLTSGNGFDAGGVQCEYGGPLDISWQSLDTMGTNDTGGLSNLYIETNTFNGLINQAIDNDSNSRVVVRFNTFNDSALGSHGQDSSQSGGRQYEIYNNTWVHHTTGNDPNGNPYPINLSYLILFRSATGIIANNVIPPISTSTWGTKAEIEFGNFNAQTVPNSIPCQTQYPAARQPGQTWIGNLPGFTSYAYPTPGTTAVDGSGYFTDPVYLWGNTGGGNYNNPGIISQDQTVGTPCSPLLPSTNFIQFGRDVMLNTVKTSGPTGAWVAYQYPHPLISGASAPPPAPVMVQHVATGIDRYPATVMKVPLPNPAGAGNCLILGVHFNSAGSISSVADDKGNSWLAGPTTTNATSAKRLNSYIATGVIGGTSVITITFAGTITGAVPAFPLAVCSEFYNIASLDVSGSNSASRTVGPITTTAAGDLIWQWGVNVSSTNANGGAYNGAGAVAGIAITAGSGFTLLNADTQVGAAAQYQVQSVAGAITPTFAATGTATWASVVIALKAAAGGSPPGSGIRIVRIQHTLLNSFRAQGRGNPVVMQFPSSGNLLVGCFNSGGASPPLITSMTDNANNTWLLPNSLVSIQQPTQVVSAQIIYAQNAVTSPTLGNLASVINITNTGDGMFVLYDIAGAAAVALDTTNIASGNQTVTGNLADGSITPLTANGLVIHVNSIDFHTISGSVASAPVVSDTVTNAFLDADGPTDVSPLDMDNAYGHAYYTTPTPINFVWSVSHQSGDPDPGAGPWSSVRAAFKGASGGGPVLINATVLIK